MTAVLETRALSVSYGGVRALADVDVEVGEGQLVGLIGPNGAGKTTWIDAVCGFVPATGETRLDGRTISGMPPTARARAGLGRTWQAAELFDDLTVRENLSVAADRRPMWRLVGEALTGRESDPPNVESTLELLGIGELADVAADELTQGQRKLVGVARALAPGPRVVCLDEPAAGLDSAESRALGQRLRQVVDSGVAMLLVDHDMGLVLGVCDRVVVLEFGRVIAAGPPEVVRRDPKVTEAYLGRAAQESQAILDASAIGTGT
ncbi:MAG: ABC transporter ATP-binding protein [Solirubrobacterales bacterium]|nr:ABC transporter ATP-binding protein [Solirubrobacterales bacterium]